MFLVALFLKFIICCTDIILCTVHRHLQRILDLGLCGLELVEVTVGQVVRLTAVGVDWCTGVAKGTDEVDILVSIPLEGVVVIVDEDGIRKALVSQFEGFDEPVVARLTSTA